MASPATSTPTVTPDVGATTTPTFDIPAHNSGDLILLSIGSDGDNVLSSIPNLNGAAWTVLATSGVVRTAISQHFAWLRAAANQATATTVTATFSDNEIYTCHAFVVTGAHATQAPEIAGPIDANATSDIDPPSLTPSWGTDDVLAFTAATLNDGGTTQLTAAPSGYADSRIDNSLSGSGSAHGTAWRQATGVASEDPGVWTANEQQVSWTSTILVRGSSGSSPQSQAIIAAVEADAVGAVGVYVPVAGFVVGLGFQ